MGRVGIAQACWRSSVRGCGPFIVDPDLQGRSLLARQGEMMNERLASLYEGLRPPALHRLRETGDRRDEVMQAPPARPRGAPLPGRRPIRAAGRGCVCPGRLGTRTLPGG